MSCNKYPGLENALRECSFILPISSATELPSWKGEISDCSPPTYPASSTHVQTNAARHPTLYTLLSCWQGVSCRCLSPPPPPPHHPFPSPQQSGGDQPSAVLCLPDTPSSLVSSGCKRPSLSPLPDTPSSPLQTAPYRNGTCVAQRPTRKQAPEPHTTSHLKRHQNHPRRCYVKRPRTTAELDLQNAK